MDLFDRIRLKCKQDGWYAGALLKARVLQHAPEPRQSAFSYAPATEEQLRACEQALGFPLPPLLRELYGLIANGGVGPGTGIGGATGGFGRPSGADFPESSANIA